MRCQDHAGKDDRDEESGTGRRPALPAWESFLLEDRQRLVRTILHAARRQVEARATSSRPRK